MPLQTPLRIVVEPLNNFRAAKKCLRGPHDRKKKKKKKK
jgi:hypothetical protein